MSVPAPIVARPSRQRSAGPEYGSDLIVDALRRHDVRYVALNPGASFRGLHDSLVNYGGSRPEVILCQHESIAVGIAQGYAKAQSPARPMAAIVHNIVGLLNASRQTYVASIDRTPLLLLGGTGPVDEARRRPRTDWHHTANVQGNAVRNFVKWDDQPATAGAIPTSFGRAYRVATTEPMGPVYLCYDAGLQEDPLLEVEQRYDERPTLLPSRIAPDPEALVQVADLLFQAERPMIVAEFVGRSHEAAKSLVTLAELLAISVVDIRSRPNFPTTHPLNVTGSDELQDADLVLAMDVKHPDTGTARTDMGTRDHRSLLNDRALWIEIGFSDLEISSWAADYGPFRNPDVSVLADTTLAIPALVELVKDRLRSSSDKREAVATRAAALAARHSALRRSWLEDARRDWNASPMTTGRVALEVWDAIKDEDWVLSAGTLSGKALRLWPFDEPFRHPGNHRGPATQIGISLGVALAHKGSGRVVVDLQPDGDLMYDAGALWVAAKHEIPLLVVMFNNRAYYQDWKHQIEVAKQRGRPVERAFVGQDLRGPDPDFAGLARSMGCYAEGPIENARELGPALRRAIAHVKDDGRPALVDAVTRFR